MSDETMGLQIDWTVKKYITCMSVLLTGFGIVIGWFYLSTFLMRLAG